MKYFIFALFSFLFLLFFQSFYLTDAQKQDLDLFLTKLQKQQENSFSFQILKKDVEKDIFFLENDKRLECKITSQEANLFIREKKGVEKLKNFQCLFQEKVNLDSPVKSQQVKYFSAEEGLYCYSSHHFFSEKVDIAFLNLSGDTIPQKMDLQSAYLVGEANHVDLFFHPKKVFEAKYLHANFSPKDLMN